MSDADRPPPHPLDVEIGRRVRMARLDRDLSARGVARTLAERGYTTFDHRTVMRIESGRRILRARELEPLAAVLGTTVRALLGPIK